MSASKPNEREAGRIRKARRDLEDRIGRESRRPLPDFSRISALKRRRLALKDRLYGLTRPSPADVRSPTTLT